MPWTEEKEAIKEWAVSIASKEITEEIFPAKDEDLDSYWEICEEGNDIEEYEFDAIPELRKMLEQSLTEAYMDSIIHPIAITTLKNKSRGNILAENDKDNGDLPDFVYVF